MQIVYKIEKENQTNEQTNKTTADKKKTTQRNKPKPQNEQTKPKQTKATKTQNKTKKKRLEVCKNCKPDDFSFEEKRLMERGRILKYVKAVCKAESIYGLHFT